MKTIRVSHMDEWNGEQLFPEIYELPKVDGVATAAAIVGKGMASGKTAVVLVSLKDSGLAILTAISAEDIKELSAAVETAEADFKKRGLCGSNGGAE